MIEALAFAQNLWAAFSFWSALAGLFGIGIIVLALTVSAYLPAGLRKALVRAGATLIVGASLYQLGSAHGARQQILLDTQRALDAETQRADRSETINRNQAAALERERAKEQVAKKKLKELTDVLNKGHDSDSVCADRDLARRLRAL